VNYLLDTNILLRLSNLDDPLHQKVQGFIDSRIGLDEFFIAPQCLFEYWSVATRPITQNGFGLSAAQAAADIRSLSVAFNLQPDPQNLSDEWLRLCETFETMGKVAHDARLVAFIHVLKLDGIVTLNRGDFLRYGIAVQTP